MRCDESCVLFLGGDPLHAVLASKALRCPAFAYTSKPRWRKHFAKFLTPDERSQDLFAKRDIDASRFEIVGHLAVDSVEIEHTSVEILKRLGLDEGLHTVTFLPGSRPVEYENAIRYVLCAAEELCDLVPEVQCCIALSPFVDKQAARASFVASGASFDFEEDGVSHVRLRNGSTLKCEWDRPHEAMSVSDLVVTLPGTNTLQLAAMRVPMLVYFPLQYAELTPVDGLLGLLSQRFRIFRMLKRMILLRKAARGIDVALPNIIAGRKVVPELIQMLLPSDLAAQTARLLNDHEALQKMSVELGKINVGNGAAARIAAEALGLAADNRKMR